MEELTKTAVSNRPGLLVEFLFFLGITSFAWDASSFALYGLPLSDLFLTVMLAFTMANATGSVSLKELVFFLTLCSLNFVALFLSANKYYFTWSSFGIPTIKVMLGLLMLVVIPSLSRRPDRLLHLACSAVSLSGWIITLYFFIDLIGGNLRGRWSGPFSDPNYLAIYLCTPISIALTRVSTSRSVKARMLPLLQCTLLSLIVVSTGSRAGFVGLLLLVLIFIGRLFVQMAGKLHRTKAIMALLRILVIVVVAAALGVFLLQVLGMSETWIGRFNIERVVSSGGAGRVDIWRELLHVSYENPLGVGVGNGKFVVGEAFGRLRSAHNLFLQSLVELGIIGMVVVSTYITHALVRIVRSTLRLARFRQTLWGFGPGALVLVWGSFTLNMLNVRFFWVLLALALLEAKIASAEQHQARLVHSAG